MKKKDEREEAAFRTKALRLRRQKRSANQCQAFIANFNAGATNAKNTRGQGRLKERTVTRGATGSSQGMKALTDTTTAQPARGLSIRAIADMASMQAPEREQSSRERQSHKKRDKRETHYKAGKSSTAQKQREGREEPEIPVGSAFVGQAIASKGGSQQKIQFRRAQREKGRGRQEQIKPGTQAKTNTGSRYAARLYRKVTQNMKRKIKAGFILETFPRLSHIRRGRVKSGRQMKTAEGKATRASAGTKLARKMVPGSLRQRLFGQVWSIIRREAILKGLFAARVGIPVVHTVITPFPLPTEYVSVRELYSSEISPFQPANPEFEQYPPQSDQRRSVEQ
jgi:hypothetical protein